MGVSLQCPFLEMEGVEEDDTELPRRRGPGTGVVASARRVSKGDSTVPVSWDAARPLEMEGVKVSLPQALA